MTGGAGHPTYVYGLAGAGTIAPADLGEPGLAGEAVDLVTHGQVAALVSSLGEHRARASRADLSAHHRVVESAAARTTLIPMQFGVVMPSAEAVVAEFLAPHEDELVALLARLDGRAELRLKATFRDGVDLREVVQRSPGVRRLRQQVLAAGSRADLGTRIELGEMVAAELQRLRELEGAAILRRLEGQAVEVRRLSDQDEHSALNAAFLVDRRHAGQFDHSVEAMADELAHRLSFELIGPLAPWDFAQPPSPVEV